MDNITKLRNKIDQIDNQIMDLLDQRFSITKEVGIEKAKTNNQILDKNREFLILEKTAKFSHSPQIKDIYIYMMNLSKSQQKEV